MTPRQTSARAHLQPHARVENASPPHGLSEHQHAERLDTGAQGQAIESDPALATVGAFDRPEERKGQAAFERQLNEAWDVWPRNAGNEPVPSGRLASKKCMSDLCN